VKRKDLFAQTFDKVHQLAVGLPPLKTYTIRLKVTPSAQASVELI